MLKYRTVALALKAFSVSPATRALYRTVGNRYGGLGRAKNNIPDYYFSRVERNLRWCTKYCPLQPDDMLAELGTGWVHWEALTLRLFYDFRAELYDVWDNRQFEALRSFLRQLRTRFGQDGYLREYDCERAAWLIGRIEQMAGFEELYKLLGFRYEVDPGGKMEMLPTGRFRAVVSAGVMEHIDAAIAPAFVENTARILMPGGITAHGINIGDHLSYYDMTMNKKEYLRYSDRAWKFWCSNGVQYINRIQRNQWLRMFEEAGLQLLEEDSTYTDVSKLKIASPYQSLSKQDLECITLFGIFMKK